MTQIFLLLLIDFSFELFLQFLLMTSRFTKCSSLFRATAFFFVFFEVVSLEIAFNSFLSFFSILSSASISFSSVPFRGLIGSFIFSVNVWVSCSEFALEASTASSTKKFNLDGTDGFRYYWHDLREEEPAKFFFSRWWIWSAVWIEAFTRSPNYELCFPCCALTFL